MLKVWLCISITAAEQMRLVQRARTACEACYQKVTSWRMWMWTSNINRHKEHQLLWVYYSTILSDSFGILCNRATWVVCKWVNWCKDSPMCYEHQHLSRFLYMSLFFLFPYSVSTSVWPMFNKSNYNKCDQWCFVIFWFSNVCFSAHRQTIT